MTEITYRLRGGGPGFKPDDIRNKYLALAKGDVSLALNFACHDVADLSKGGMLRLMPVEGVVEVNVDDPRAAL